MREGPSRWGLLPRATCPYSEAARPAWSVLRGVALLPSQAPHPFLVFNCDIRHCVTAEECQDAVPVVNRSKGFGSTATRAGGIPNLCFLPPEPAPPELRKQIFVVDAQITLALAASDRRAGVFIGTH